MCTLNKYVHLWNITKTWNILSQSYAEMLAYAFNTSRLDYCNLSISGHLKRTWKAFSYPEQYLFILTEHFILRLQVYLCFLEFLKVECESEPVLGFGYRAIGMNHNTKKRGWWNIIVDFSAGIPPVSFCLSVTLSAFQLSDTSYAGKVTRELSRAVNHK